MARINIRSNVKFSINPAQGEEVVRKLDKKFKSKEPDSPASGMERFAENIYGEVLRQYDSTASLKNKRRTGRLRSAIEKRGPFLLSDGTVAFDIGMKLPPYWRFVEYGIKPAHKEQTYQVVGWNSAGKLSGGIGRSFRGETEVVHFMVYRMHKGGMRLISRTKKDLAGIKRKLTLEFSHPGFRGHYFLRAGAIYAIKNAKEFLGKELDKSLKRVQTLRAAGEL